MSRSKFQPRKSLEGRIPDAPSPTLMLQKLSQSLPLIFHLMISSAVFFYTFLLSILTHLIDGPILDSWDLQTTILHSMLKSVLLTNPPQGRHSLDIVRFATSFKVPKFVFKNTTIQEASITLQNAENFSQQVRDALDIKNLRWKDTPSDVRTVHGEWIIPKVTTPEDDTVVLYLHGGAHIFMSPGTHRGITSEIAKACKARVFAADYRLAPENPFPAGIEDALAAYLALALPEGINGSSCRFNEEFQVVSTTRIFIMGDSSGGCLTLQLLQALRALNLPMPAGAVMLSPFLDHKFDSISWHVNWNYDFLSLDMAGVDWAVEIYSNGTARDHPSISPMYADLKNFPPMLIQSGDSEVVTDDAVRFHAYSMAHGNQVELQLYKHMFHVFHTFPHLSQTSFAFARIGEFVNSQKVDIGSDSGLSLDGSPINELGGIYMIDKHDVAIKTN